MKKSGASQGQSASELISKRIAELGDWRGETLSRMRKLIKEADPDVVEEWKWMGTPIWSHDGIICTGESYKNVVKLTFSKGASLKDPARLFNSSLDGNARRAIDIHEGEEVDESAFKALVRQAVALNSSGKSKPFLRGEHPRLRQPTSLAHQGSGKEMNSPKFNSVEEPGRLHRVVSPLFALNRTGRGGRRQDPIRADHLRRATGFSMFGLLATGAGAMAGSTVRAPRG